MLLLLISLLLEGKADGGLRRSDEVTRFYNIIFNAFKLELFHLITVLRRSFSLRL